MIPRFILHVARLIPGFVQQSQGGKNITALYHKQLDVQGIACHPAWRLYCIRNRNATVAFTKRRILWSFHNKIRHNWCLQCSREWDRDSASPQITRRSQINICASVCTHKHIQMCIQTCRHSNESWVMLAPEGLCQSPSMSYMNQTKNKMKQDERVEEKKKKSKQKEVWKTLSTFLLSAFSLQQQNSACIQN